MTPSYFLSTLDALLNDPAGKIISPASLLFSRFPKQQADLAFDRVLGKHPMLSSEDVLGSFNASGTGFLTYLFGVGQRTVDRERRYKLERIIRSYTIARPPGRARKQECDGARSRR